MEIIRNKVEEKQFEDLRIGEVFIAKDDKKLYMKTDEAFEYHDDRDHYLNAVSLEDGSLIKFKDWEEVSIPKKVTLTVDE